MASMVSHAMLSSLRVPILRKLTKFSHARLILAEIDVDTTLQLKPRPSNQALIAWQFLGQPLHEWPSWVQSVCSLQRGDDGQLELRHERQSGAQIVYLEEWLVRDLDGGVCFYTDDEVRRQFELARPNSNRPA
jgi:hypothetical protein